MANTHIVGDIHNDIDLALTIELTKRVPPFIWSLFFSIMMSFLTFYDNISTAARIASVVFTMHQSINLIFNLFTEEVVLNRDLKNTWLTKLTIPRTVVEQKRNIQVNQGGFFSHSGLFGVFDEKSPLKQNQLQQRYYEYMYVVRIPSPLYKNNYMLTYYFFIPFFKIGIITSPFLYSQHLIDNATVKPYYKCDGNESIISYNNEINGDDSA